MKSTFPIVILVFILLTFTNCSKENNHKVCIKNELLWGANRVRFGELRFPNLESGDISEFQTIEEGDYIFTAMVGGVTNSVSEPIKIEGDGIYKWQISIKSTTEIVLYEISQ